MSVPRSQPGRQTDDQPVPTLRQRAHDASAAFKRPPSRRPRSHDDISGFTATTADAASAQ